MSRAWPEQRQVISLFLVGVKADMSAPGRLTMYSAPGYGDCQTANQCLIGRGIDYEQIDIDAFAVDTVLAINGGGTSKG